jgi:hypothetical protein
VLVCHVFSECTAALAQGSANLRANHRLHPMAVHNTCDMLGSRIILQNQLAELLSVACTTASLCSTSAMVC